MTDTLPVAELESTPRQKGPVPFLWLAIAMLVTAAIAALLSGAGDDDPEALPQARLAAAAGAAAEVDFAFEATITSGTAGGGEPLTLVGVYDAETRRIRGTVSTAGDEVEIIQEQGIQYMRFGAGNPLAQAAGGKPWARFDLSAMAGDTTSTPVGENPLDTFARLGEISGPIVRVGTEDVRGVSTVHFRTTVDASARSLPPGVTEAARASLRNIDVDVWLDDDDRPRRHRQAITLANPSATRVVTTMDAFDFGRAVSIDLPPADQVGEFDPSALIQANLDALTKPSE